MTTPTARLSLLEDTVASQMAAEYLAFRKWAARRHLTYIPSVRDYFGSQAAHLGVSLDIVATRVREASSK